jgi:transcriptional regulator with XRE-family HTH domain
VTEEQLRGGPTVRRMLLGARLRRLRTEAGVSREDAGEAIRASAWKIHRLENGQVSYKERDIADLVTHYGVTDPVEVAMLIAMAREANMPGWWTPYSDLLPQWFRAYMDLEAVAAQIRSYEALFVPGLLQTEEYMRALMHATLRDNRPEEIERRVVLRLSRQRLLTEEGGPHLWAVMDEAALRRPVGGKKVLRAQIERLIEATSLPRVRMQVLSLSAGAHAAMVGAFSILRFADQDLPDVVYLEHATSAMYLDKPEDVEEYAHIMSSIGVHGAPPDQTAGILGELLHDLA